jgi:hypothetical protein
LPEKPLKQTNKLAERKKEEKVPPNKKKVF